MHVCDSLVPYFFACLLTNVDIISSREYFFKENVNPSYLHYGKNNFEDENFPEDVKINTLMSTVTGTLLYSLDKNMNQLIVSLRDALPHIIDIEFNKHKFSVSLSSLCGCERCRYEILELRIQLDSFINIQCNGGIIQRKKKHNGTELNDAYPIWLPDINSKVATPFNNSMCLVNTPQYNDIYPNQYQMSGCIFQVSYNELPITFTNVSSKIEPKCNKTCTENICNGGQCYETFSDTPICNCTATFLNGRFCNATIKKLNLRIIDQTWQIDMFKVSWKSSMDKIFEIRNKHISILLGYGKDDSSLYIEYNSTKTLKKNIKVVLAENYIPNTEYIFILYFHIKNIDVRLLSNGSWTNELIPLNRDMKKEIFDSITLRSGVGYIDMVYKDEQEYKWRQLYIGNYTYLEYDDDRNIMNSIADGSRKQTIIIAVAVIFGIFCIILCIVVIILCRRLKSSDRYGIISSNSNSV